MDWMAPPYSLVDVSLGLPGTPTAPCCQGKRQCWLGGCEFSPSRRGREKKVETVPGQSQTAEPSTGGSPRRMTVPELRTLLSHLLDVRVWDVPEILRWSQWRQTRNERAAASHKKRRVAELQNRQAKRDHCKGHAKNVRQDKRANTKSQPPPSRPR